MTVVEDPTHDDIISMLRDIREEGFAARVLADDDDDGQIIITAATSQYGTSKRHQQQIVGHYRVHDQRSGAIDSHDDVFGICQALQRGFERIEDPESLFD